MTTDKKPEQIVLKNVRVKYAKVIRPGQAFDEGQPDLWSVNMYLNAEETRKVVAAGATAKVDKDGNDYFIAKRNVINKNREAVKPPVLVDGKKQPFDQEIGNGSICNVAVTPFEWKKGQKTGVLLYLNALQVINHVAMSNGVDAFDVVEDAPSNGNDESDLPF